MPQLPRPQVFLLLIFAALFMAAVQADQDTNLRLNQGIDYRASRQDRHLLDESVSTTLVIDGQPYLVGNNLNDVGRALYVSVQRQQWADAFKLRERYVALPGHDIMLLAYADGALARAAGHLGQAEFHYRKLLEMQADFLPGQLELARVLFENHKDRESAAAFRQIKLTIDSDDAHNNGLLNTINSFTDALAHREQWQGSLAVGPTWADNLNRSSESRTTYRLESSEGIYVVERRMPEAVSGDGTDYEAALNKRVALSGHHGVFARVLAYGQAYNRQGKYNEDTLTSSTGYSYQDAYSQYSFGPSFEYNRLGSEPMYSAWGLRGDWVRNLSATRLIKLEAEYKELVYRGQYGKTYDGGTTALYATVWQVLPRQWVLFGGGDLTRRGSEDDTEAYIQKGLRFGVAKEFDIGISAVLFASWRIRQYDAYSALLDSRRHELEKGYTIIARVPQLAYHGFVPGLTVKYSEVQSNVSWLYNYERSSVSIKLEKQF